jgi:transcriptional regulator with XRE-family HTH domain
MRKKFGTIDEKAIIGRVRQLRERYSGPRGRSSFARELGISPSTYNYYETKRVPPVGVLVRMCQVTGADLPWLLTGQVADQKLSLGPNAALLRKLDELFTSNPELSAPVMAFVELLSEKKSVERQLREQQLFAAAEGRSGWIPVLGRTAAGIVQQWDKVLAAGPESAVTELEDLVEKHTGRTIIDSVEGKVSVDLQARTLLGGVQRRQANLVQVSGETDEQVAEFVECEEIRRLYPDSFALRIDGDSMAPRIDDGDIVILSASVPAGHGQIAIARVENQIGVTCKLIRSGEKEIHLIPINERYEAKVIPKRDLQWALAVLCHIKVQGASGP